MNKRGISLSINFIVLLILALVVFGMGLILFSKIYGGLKNIHEGIDEETRKEMQKICESTPEQVCIYPTSLNILKGKSKVIGVGILNIDGSESFSIHSTLQNCYSKEEEIICSNQVILKEQRDVNVKLNKRTTFGIPARVDRSATPGTYSILVEIKQDGNSLSKHLVYIEVS
jgi:Na+-transporting methylmalonyl-CoA/oxaloacetate decarboxylase gamma subunit